MAWRCSPAPAAEDTNQKRRSGAPHQHGKLPSFAASPMCCAASSLLVFPWRVKQKQTLPKRSLLTEAVPGNSVLTAALMHRAAPARVWWQENTWAEGVGDGGRLLTGAGTHCSSVLACPNGFRGAEKRVKSGILGNVCVFPALGALTKEAGLWVDADPLFGPALLAWHSKLNEAHADASPPQTVLHPFPNCAEI